MGYILVFGCNGNDHESHKYTLIIAVIAFHAYLFFFIGLCLFQYFYVTLQKQNFHER